MMRPTDKKIHDLLQTINDQTRPELDRTILEDCYVELDHLPTSRTTIWSTIMHHKMVKPIAAAIILIAGFLGLTLFDKTVPTVYAIEQTVEAMRGVKNLRLSMKMGDQQMKMFMVINPQTGLADHIRMDADSGDVTITIPGQTYIYNRQQNQVSLLGQELLRNDLNFHDVINSLVEQTNAADGRIEITNQFNDLAGQDVICVTIIRPDDSLAGQFLIAPESRLPIYLGVESGEELTYMGPIEYDVDIADDAFEFVIPEGANVIDNRPEELKAQSAHASAVADYNILETAAALQTAYNAHGILIDRQGRRVEVWAEIDPETGKMSKGRLEYEDGGLYIMADGKTYFEDDGIVGIKDGLFFDSNIMFNNFIAEAAQFMGDQGKMSVGKVFSEEFGKEVISVSVKYPWLHLDAVIDPDTKRPIKLSLPFTTFQTEILDHTELIEYNVDLPENCFEYELGPDVLVLGKHLDQQFANDPNYGMPYEDTEDIQQVCRTIAERYLQAKIDMDIDTIKQLHSIYVNRWGSNKMIEKAELQEITWNEKIVETLEFKPAYEYRPRQTMVPCTVIKERNGQRKEVLCGVIVYLRDHNGQKSAVITGYFPNLSGVFSVTPEGAELEAVTYDGLEPGAFIQKWLVLGPVWIKGDQAVHRIAFDTHHIDPAEFEPTYDIDGKAYQWRLLTDGSGTIDLSYPFGTIPGILYAWAEVEMPEETDAVLGIGSDDGVKVWLNGELVHENWISRGVTIDEDRVPVTFKQGTNHLVLKIQNQGGGPWGFCCRLLEE